MQACKNSVLPGALPAMPASCWPTVRRCRCARALLNAAQGWRTSQLPERTRMTPVIDPFGRSITYLRVSVTDRCDLRCVYCMAEDMTFLPKREVLSLEELDRICAAFIRLGTSKIRITGGEPLVRRDVMTLFQSLGARLGHGLNELVGHHQRDAACEAGRRPARGGRAADQRFARHARSREIRPDHPLGEDRARPWTASSPPRKPASRSRSTRSR